MIRRGVWLAMAVVSMVVVTPGSAGAQRPTRLPLIAILEPGPAATPSPGLAVMKQALADLGWADGRTARFETRYAEWHPVRMAEEARALVLLGPDVLYTHSTFGTRAVASATRSIPIVIGAPAISWPPARSRAWRDRVGT